MEDFSTYTLELSNTKVEKEPRTEGVNTCWNPPTEGVFKINVDGAFDARSGKGGVGLVVRDSLGNTVEAKAIPIPISFSAELVEALGVRFALYLAVNNADKAYIVEGDAQSVIQMLQGTSNVKANLEVVIRDSIYLASRLNSCSFNFVSRNCNGVANVIAKYALSLALPTTWQGTFPGWICREAALDVSVLI